MPLNKFIKTQGWDVGGAHLKLVLASDGKILNVYQFACPLWKGIDELSICIRLIKNSVDLFHGNNVVTMTGELVDYFENRKQGVIAITEELSKNLCESSIYYYAGEDGLVDKKQAIMKYEKVASANWLASASYAAKNIPQGLFIDIGSTTTDIVAINNHKVLYDGYTDEQRLIAKELIYCGVIRTPIFAISKSALINNQQVPVINEYFSNMADVYRITNELAKHVDLSTTLDGRAKDIISSVKRLARMFANDATAKDLEIWCKVAKQIRGQQIQIIKDACRHHVMKRKLPLTSPIIGAGVGRFLVKELALQLGREYIDYETLFHVENKSGKFSVGDCAPAAAVACIANI